LDDSAKLVFSEQNAEPREILPLMAKARPSDARHRLAEPPSRVEITILVDRPRPGLRQRIVTIGLRGRRGAVVALVLIGVVVSTLAAAAVIGTRTSGAQHAPKAGAQTGGPAGVAAGYGYPLPCLSVMISRENSTYARADFNRAVPCGRYDGSATAIFHRVDGSWRRAVDAVAYRCPVAGIPRPVQAELGVCP
jgi:hypothetical protein